MFTGHIEILRGLAYMFLQICGACFGILMVVSIANFLLTCMLAFWHELGKVLGSSIGVAVVLVHLYWHQTVLLLSLGGS